jgi:hypothetical protein
LRLGEFQTILGADSVDFDGFNTTVFEQISNSYKKLSDTTETPPIESITIPPPPTEDESSSTGSPSDHDGEGEDEEDFDHSDSQPPPSPVATVSHSFDHLCLDVHSSLSSTRNTFMMTPRWNTTKKPKRSFN